ncbi:mRNA-capping enzyme [Cylas formicarius]|uniref:mRNA-capping enzyme n=1 Tax=Cylas formicarius TaxID=197179 RepID=UPI002958725C|nr:mRNA-capping enzyme [Cylas formicarius]
MSRPISNPGPPPKRWLYCPRKSHQLIVGKFMALKTPLSSNFDDQIPPECRFHPKMFFDICNAKKIKFGLWIDLTNTTRFYNKKEIQDYGCRYVKLQCRGHGETPSVEQTKMFIQLVSNFISQNPLKSIAVHCTHGFNRTGFLIVSYLVENMDFSLEVALQTFAQARPVGIYKDDYLEELYKRYDVLEDKPPPPNLPEWCFESDDRNDENGDDHESLSTASTSSSEQNNTGPPRKKLKRHKDATTKFMEGVPNVEYFDEPDKAFQLQRKVQRMCGWKDKEFPGCQPVSMTVDNLKFLKEKSYRVSWKADGTRYMMLIDGKDEVYFFDRNNTVFKVNGLTFLHRKDLSKHLKDTLLDGEMVIDEVGEENIPRYLAYDIIQFEGQNIGKEFFYPTRLHVLDVEIIKPRYAAMERMLINKSTEPFSIRKKDFWPISQTASLLSEKFAKSLSHKPDGLIFQPSKDPYIAGRCDEVLKWKPLSMNSVDFRLKIVTENGPGIIPKKVGYLYVGQLDQPFAKIKSKDVKHLDNKIIECKYENDQWVFMRERTDKVYPNSYNTAKAVFSSILKPVTKEKLLEFIERESYNEDCDIMPPPPSKKIRR